MNKGMKMMLMSRSNDKSRRYGARDTYYNPNEHDYPRDEMGDRYANPRDEYEGAYDYDRYRYKNGRFAPKPRSMYDGGVYDAFYDRRGRRHYDDGRYAPMRGEYDGGAYDMMGFDPYGNGRGRGDMYYPPDIYGGHDDEERRKAEKRRRDRQVGYASGDIYEDDGEYFFKGRFGMDGRKRERMPEHMDREIAEEWTRRMKNEDGSKGPHWDTNQVKQLMQQKNIDCDFWDFYAALNMMYSDYCKVAKKFNVNSIDFYVDMAKAWLDDEDAGAGDRKTLMYYECVAK